MGRGRWMCSRALPAAVVLAALALPSSAAAAVTKPSVTTGGAGSIGQNAANLNGSVNPNGGATGWYFEYGTTKAYGSRTPTLSAGSGTKARKVKAPIGGLAPATTYHYRLIAGNRKGRTLGGDRTFKTKPQPLGVSLAGNPNPVHVNGSTTLAGTLSGTGNAGRQVVLQSNPYPYTQGFKDAGNIQVTDANGNFSFPILSVPVTTQYRVLMPTKPGVVSPIVVEGTVVRIATHVRVHRHARSSRVHFYGSLYPPADGTQVQIQKLVNGTWKSIGSTSARHRNANRSTFTKTLWQRRGGQFRVFVNDSGPRVPWAGRVVVLHHLHR
jgi:hypothetical protein